MKKYLIILATLYVGYNIWIWGKTEPDFSELERKSLTDPELHARISDDYIRIFFDFYENNPKKLDMESYYIERSKEKSTKYWQGLIMKAKFYHKNYANEMFAG